MKIMISRCQADQCLIENEKSAFKLVIAIRYMCILYIAVEKKRILRVGRKIDHR